MSEQLAGVPAVAPLPATEVAPVVLRIPTTLRQHTRATIMNRFDNSPDIHRAAESLRAELSGLPLGASSEEEARNCSALERLLFDRIVSLYYSLIAAETAHSNCKNLKAGDYWSKQVAMYNRQYLAAIKTLAEVRKMMTPTVNVAMPGALQVNL